MICTRMCLTVVGESSVSMSAAVLRTQRTRSIKTERNIQRIKAAVINEYHIGGNIEDNWKLRTVVKRAVKSKNISVAKHFSTLKLPDVDIELVGDLKVNEIPPAGIPGLTKEAAVWIKLMVAYPTIFKPTRGTAAAFEAYLTYLTDVCNLPREKLRDPAMQYFKLLGPAEKALWPTYLEMLVKEKKDKSRKNEEAEDIPKDNNEKKKSKKNKEIKTDAT